MNKIALSEIKFEKRIKIRNPYETVYLGRDDDGNMLIIKEFNKKNDGSKLSFLREKYVDFTHKNLNKLLLADCDNEYCYIVREFLQGNDLESFSFPLLID